MARDEFFADVRGAVGFMAPSVEADSPFTDTNYIEKMLRSADLWLTPSVVSAFKPEDFADIDEGTRVALSDAVRKFRSVAAQVNPSGPALPEQRDAARPPFKQIVETVQILVRKDWVGASTALLADAENWAREQGWPTKRFPKDITEDFIGKYNLDKLVYSAEGSQLALIPLGRFAPGTHGIFDLAVLPVYDSVQVVRRNDRWFIDPLPNETGRVVWSREAFIARSLLLARLS